MTCSRCGAPTDAIYLVCDSCLERIAAETRTAQGLTPMATDDPKVAAWLARLLLGRERRAS